jgi:hypothetical protein
MSDPADALQAWQFATLTADVPLKDKVDDRVFDAVPAGVTFPYAVIGEAQVIGDDTDGCGDGSEVITRTHVWSRKPGRTEVKQIAAEVRRVLKAIPVLDGFTVSVAEFEQCQYLADPDGLSQHAVIEHRYLISHND